MMICSLQACIEARNSFAFVLLMSLSLLITSSRLFTGSCLTVRHKGGGSTLEGNEALGEFSHRVSQKTLSCSDENVIGTGLFGPQGKEDITILQRQENPGLRDNQIEWEESPIRLFFSYVAGPQLANPTLSLALKSLN